MEVVAARTGLSQADAEKRVSQIVGIWTWGRRAATTRPHNNPKGLPAPAAANTLAAIASPGDAPPAMSLAAAAKKPAPIAVANAHAKKP